METSLHLIAKDNRLSLALAISLCLFVLIGATASGTAQWPGFGREVRYDFGYLNASTLVVADFNGDGVSDLAVTYTVYAGNDGWQDRVTLLLSNGDGTLQTPTTTYAIGTYSRQSAAGDFNGDGKTDLVIAVSNDTSSGINVLLGNGDGTFQTAVFYPLAGRPTYITVRDFNQDNHSDVAVKTDDNVRTFDVNESGISVLLSRNDATFLPTTEYPIPDRLYGIEAGDFNGDGKLDLVTLNGTASAVSVLPGRGDGTFSDPITSPSSSSSTLLAAADFNRDGKLDLIVGKAILLGQGDGTFASGLNYSNLSIWRVTTADFNGDGLVDLAVVVISNDYYDVVVLPGNGDGTFQPPLTFPVAQGAQSLVVGDFNGDGKPDLAYEGGLFGYFVSVLLNSVFTPEPCRKPGPTTLITDAVGDAPDGNPSHDIESVSVAETFSQEGEQLLVFKLKVADLHANSALQLLEYKFQLPLQTWGIYANEQCRRASIFSSILFREYSFQWQLR
jgi:hypothetical protein